MGLFGSRTKYYVSSVVYNMNGDIVSPDYLKTSLISAVLRNTDSIPQSLTNCLLAGPAMRLRHYFNWAESSGYNNNVGLATSTFYPDTTADRNAIQDYLENTLDLDFNQNVSVSFSQIGYYDYILIAEHWVYENKPKYINDKYNVEEFSVVVREWKEWESVWVPDPGGDSNSGYYERKLVTKREYRSDIRITFSDGSISEINTAKYNKAAIYLYVKYQIETSYLIYTEVENKTIIYASGSGNSLYDSFFDTPMPLKKSYAPYVPIRLENKFISAKFLPETYKYIKKAYKKIYGQKGIDSLIETLADNDSIGDIDYAYLNFGIALNTKHQEGKRYIFEFFNNIYENTAIAKDLTYEEWQAQFRNTLFNPNRTPKTITIRSTYGVINFHINIEFANIGHYYKNGTIFNGAKIGDCNITAKNVTYSRISGYDEDTNDPEYEDYTVEHTYFYKQVTTNQYLVLDIPELCYGNYVYAGKWVAYSGLDAMNDKDESGFIVPLQISTLKEIGIRRASNLASQCNYIVFNCWVKKKKKWYQTGIFAVVLVVIIVIVCYFCPPAGAALAGSLGGATAAAVGLTVGSLIYTIVAVAVNMLVGMIIAAILSPVMNDIFGEEWGGIATMIATVVIMGTATNMASSGASFGDALSTTISDIFSPENLMNFSSFESVAGKATFMANAYASYVQGQASDLMQETNAYVNYVSDKIQEIQDLYKSTDLFGNKIDSRQIANALLIIPEQWKSYVSRTLLTGSDIVRLDHSHIYDYAALTTSTKLPIV